MPNHIAAYGTPQDSPPSSVLYRLYMADFLSQDAGLRFGIGLYRASASLDRNVELLAKDVQSILE